MPDRDSEVADLAMADRHLQRRRRESAILRPNNEVEMGQIQQARHGRFVLRAHGKKAPNGKFAATFSVTEVRGAQEFEVMCSSGLLFDIEIEAADDGMRAARRWLDRTHPGA